VLIAGTDGSEIAIQALRAGLALLPADEPVLVVMAVEAADHSLVTGGGHAGGVMTEDEFHAQDAAAVTVAEDQLRSTVDALGLADAETLVLRGSAGPSLCELAAARHARAIVLGTRGRGGMKRALLGSVSDFVVRNAPCPVVITRPTE
jgi:nucleotide-binding universal stress UspA family protein